MFIINLCMPLLFIIKSSAEVPAKNIVNETIVFEEANCEGFISDIDLITIEGSLIDVNGTTSYCFPALHGPIYYGMRVEYMCDSDTNSFITYTYPKICGKGEPNRTTETLSKCSNSDDGTSTLNRLKCSNSTTPAPSTTPVTSTTMYTTPSPTDGAEVPAMNILNETIVFEGPNCEGHTSDIDSIYMEGSPTTDVNGTTSYCFPTRIGPMYWGNNVEYTCDSDTNSFITYTYPNISICGKGEPNRTTEALSKCSNSDDGTSTFNRLKCINNPMPATSLTVETTRFNGADCVQGNQFDINTDTISQTHEHNGTLIYDCFADVINNISMKYECNSYKYEFTIFTYPKSPCWGQPIRTIEPLSKCSNLNDGTSTLVRRCCDGVDGDCTPTPLFTTTMYTTPSPTDGAFAMCLWQIMVVGLVAILTVLS